VLVIISRAARAQIRGYALAKPSPAIALGVTVDAAQGGAVVKYEDEEISELMSKRRRGYP